MAKKGTKPGAPADPAAAARDAMFEELLSTLSAISGSLGAIALRLAPAREKLKTQGDQIRYLGKLGLKREAIAAILATTEATVGSRMTESQKPKTKTARRKRSGSR